MRGGDRRALWVGRGHMVTCRKDMFGKAIAMNDCGGRVRHGKSRHRPRLVLLGNRFRDYWLQKAVSDGYGIGRVQSICVETGGLSQQIQHHTGECPPCRISGHARLGGAPDLPHHKKGQPMDARPKIGPAAAGGYQGS